MHEILIEWMTVVDFISPSLHKCFESVKWLITLTTHQPNVRLYHVKTGTAGYVLTRVSIGASMVSVANVEGNIKHERKSHATLLSKLAAEKDIAVATQRAEAAAREGPRTLPNATKRTNQSIIDPPRFRRRYVWSDSINKQISPSALDTESALPLPCPPPHLVNDPSIQTTLHEMRDFIKVDTPFDVDQFEYLLRDHPNQPFVKSVMHGLRNGFWPFDEGEWRDELSDISENYASEDIDLDAIRLFRDKELSADRWSKALPLSTLLPNMKFSPMFVVWQNEKPRVVTDHKSSRLNDSIPRSEAHVKYDDMHPFGQTLRQARAENPSRRLILFKSDVASAFLNLPAHPIWQLRQIVTVDKQLYIVRRLVFGNRASPRCWCAVSSLICWLAIYKFNVDGLHVYMDDFFGWDYDDNLVYYHGRLRPYRQVQLLLLWEMISCPFEDKKQDHGEVLKIIGFFVDINRGTITLTSESINNIVSKIHIFLATPNRQPRLREWQRLGGHLNWVLNVLPWGRPALSELYRKTSGKTHNPPIFINSTIRSDLLWLTETIPKAIGVRFVDSGFWEDSDADLTVWTDANLSDAFAFTYNNEGLVYRINSQTPNAEKVDIFFLELLAILSAIHYIASNFSHPPAHLLIFTDSLDSVGVFNSLSAAQPMHSSVLLGVAQVILYSGIDLRVRHIEGKQNIKADLLSRLLFDEFHRKFPSIHVRLFDPPRDLLPARWRKSF